MNRYYFTFSVGSAVYRLDIKASTRAIAEKRLRNMFVKNAVITIKECYAVAIQQ